MELFWSTFNSPVGSIYLVATRDALVRLQFGALGDENDFPFPVEAQGRVNSVLKQAIHQLAEYFSGDRQKFDLPLQLKGTPFQRRVWLALREIPYGRLWSYSHLAKRIGQPGAVRAVGNANGRNPLPIIIPCHRVIRKNGKLGGYSSGLEIKRMLLKIEGVDVSRLTDFLMD